MGRTLLDKIWDAHTVRVEDGGRCVLYIDRQYIHEVTSPVAFAGIERRGFSVARPSQITATADHNIPTVDQHLPDRGAGVAAASRDAGRELRPPRYRALRRGTPQAGYRAHHRPGTGIHAAGHDHRLRRQPHFDPRGFGRRGVRRGNFGGRNGLRQPVYPADQTPYDAHYGRRRAASGRRGQGCHPLHHLEAHRFGRHGLFHRVCRQYDPFAFDGGPHDGLQHEYRVRRSGRHDRPRREDLRVPSGPRTRAAGSRLR